MSPTLAILEKIGSNNRPFLCRTLYLTFPLNNQLGTSLSHIFNISSASHQPQISYVII
jgi:hypothetical protein